jgi:hypothetical protein
MQRYTVRLLKTVANDTGHESEVVQRELAVLAANEEEAAASVRREFCCSQNIKDPGFYVDRLDVQPFGSLDSGPHRRPPLCSDGGGL